jgi:hypothetical protein
MERSGVPENSNEFIADREREREIIKRAIVRCDEEMQNKSLYVPTEKQRERTASYTGVSVADIKRIRKISIKKKDPQNFHI